MSFVPLSPGDVAFAVVYTFGFGMCIHAIWTGFSDLDRSEVNIELLPGIAGFAVFPLINTMIGCALLAFWLTRNLTNKTLKIVVCGLSPLPVWLVAVGAEKLLGATP